MIALDTDVLSLLDHPGSDRTRRLLDRLDRAEREGDVVGVTVVTFEEQMRGWLSYINSRRRSAEQVDAYLRLSGIILRFQQFDVLPFTAAAAGEFESLRRSNRRAGTMDLKIAAIAKTHGATLLSANARDFADVPGLKFEHFL